MGDLPGDGGTADTLAGDEVPSAPPVARAADPLLGRTLGEFVVRARLGEGGFGAVYRAEQRALAREAVIKVLHSRHQANDGVIQRFLQEARLASRLDHPFAAHIYAFGAEPDGLLWIAMELVRGTPLDTALESGGPIPLERFVPLLERICEVLQAAHEQGIVHRDIKPANIMVLSRAGRYLPKLLDFGIAKLVGDPVVDAPSARALADSGELRVDVTREGAVLGSPPYMAPEQWTAGGKIGPHTDLYALGALAYEAVTGRRAFAGKTLMAIATAHAKHALPSLGPGFPPALDAVLAKAVAKRAEDRYASAVEFAAAFRRAAGYDIETAAVPRLPEPLRDRVERTAPQPLAEAVAALEAARTLPQALTAMVQTFEIGVRLVALVALAARSRLGAALGPDAPEVTELLRQLSRRTLTDDEWLDLARGLTAPFVAQPGLHPVPELIAMFHGEARLPAELADVVGQLRAAVSARVADEVLQRLLATGRETLQAFLARLEPLDDYPLVVADGGAPLSWSGLRRPRRARVSLHGPPLTDGHPVLLGRDGAPLVRLHPLVQLDRPTPDAAPELFLFEGQGRHGPKLVALPYGFERRDPAIAEWLRGHLLVESRDAAAQAPADERAPYRGLAAFAGGDAALFFGREREAEIAANRLRQQPLLLVVGPSGAGKSSFVQAGLVPLLEGTRVVVVRPGPAPLAALVARLPSDEGQPLTPARLAADPALLGARLAALGPQALLVIDQLEELFTLGAPAEERTAYVEALVHAALEREGAVRVIATLRDDFLLRAEQLPALRARLSSSLFLLGTPDRGALLRILHEPLRQVGYRFEDAALAEEMVTAVEELPGALPLLSFTAAMLWQRRDRHFQQLTRAAYQALGGVGGALAQHAEETLASLRPREQELVREAFRHLVTAEGTRAVLARADLVHLLGGDADAEQALERLVNARLLVVSDGAGGEQRVEIVHEALLSAWPRLVTWRREDAEGARLRDQLRAAARQWDERGRPRGLLWRGDALLELRAWRARHGQTLTPVDAAFADASVADESRGRRLRLTLLAAAVVVLSIGLFTVGALYRSSRAAEAEAREDQGRQAWLNGNPERAILYLSQAYSSGRDTPALRYLLGRVRAAFAPRVATLVGHSGPVRSARPLHDGRELVTASDDGTVRFWDVVSGRELRSIAVPAPVKRAEPTPDGELLVTTAQDGVVRVYRAQSGEEVRRLGSPSPDGRRVNSARLVGAGDRVVTASGPVAMLWEVTTGSLLATWEHGAPIWGLTVSTRGDRVLTYSSNGRWALWDVRSGHQVVASTSSPSEIVPALSADGARLLLAGGSTLRLRGTDAAAPNALELDAREPLDTMALSSDGTLIAATTYSLRTLLWDARTGRLLWSLAGPTARAYHARFSPDGSRLAVSTQDGAIYVWEVRRGRLLVALRGHRERSLIEEFDGHRLLTSSRDGTARVWDVDRTILEWSLEQPSLPYAARLTPDGKRLLVSLDDLRVRTMDPDSGAEVVARSSPAAGRPAFLSPDGQTAATVAGRDLVLWDVQTGQPRHRLHETHGAGDVTENGVVFSRDGRTVMTAVDGNETASLWDVETGALRAEVPTGSQVLAAAALGDGWAAFGGEDGSVVVHELAGNRGFRLTGHRAEVSALAFSPDGRALASGSRDQSAIVWELATRQARVTAVGHREPISAVAFARDGGLLLTASADATVRVWDARSGALLDVLEHGASVYDFALVGADRVLTASLDRTVNLFRLPREERSPVRVARDIRCELHLALETSGVSVLSPTVCAD